MGSVMAGPVRHCMPPLKPHATPMLPIALVAAAAANPLGLAFEALSAVKRANSRVQAHISHSFGHLTHV